MITFQRQEHNYDSLFSTPQISEVLSDRVFFGEMLSFEFSLAQAEEECGVIPFGTAAVLSQIKVEHLDLGEIRVEGGLSGNLCIPFVKALTKAARDIDSRAAGYIHWGATSQDVIDTALLLQLRKAWRIIQSDLSALGSELCLRIQEHRKTLMPGRTWLQQAPPVTLGLKMATWLDALQRHRLRAVEAQERIFTLQFGGAVGTLAPLGDFGLSVAEHLAQRLGLAMPALPWHTQRDRMAELAALLSMLTGSLGKIGRDVALLMQTEIDELLEPASEGKGGSSTMPHKQNPVGCAVILSAATRVPGLANTMFYAMIQEHERGLGGWHAEWETITEICRLTAGSLVRTLEIIDAPCVKAEAMERNLNLLRGAGMSEAVSFRLAPKFGKWGAHLLIESACRRSLSSNTSLLHELQTDPVVSQTFSPEDLAEMLTPAKYLGSTELFISRVLEHEKEWSTDANS